MKDKLKDMKGMDLDQMEAMAEMAGVDTEDLKSQGMDMIKQQGLVS